MRKAAAGLALLFLLLSGPAGAALRPDTPPEIIENLEETIQYQSAGWIYTLEDAEEYGDIWAKAPRPLYAIECFRPDTAAIRYGDPRMKSFEDIVLRDHPNDWMVVLGSEGRPGPTLYYSRWKNQEKYACVGSSEDTGGYAFALDRAPAGADLNTLRYLSFGCVRYLVVDCVGREYAIPDGGSDLDAERHSNYLESPGVDLWHWAPLADILEAEQKDMWEILGRIWR